MDAAINSQEQGDRAQCPQLSGWLWKPWYAKLWWSAIPLWWASMALAMRMDVSFYRSGLAGYLNVLFFPITALMVLGVGYVRERLDSFVGQGHGVPLSDEEAQAFFAAHSRRELARTMEGWRAMSDPMDPRSGSLWIGNSMNPNNPAYIDPDAGKHG